MEFRLFSGKGPLIGYVVAGLLLLVAGLATYRSLAQLMASEAGVDHTQRVLLRSEQVVSLLKDAETAQRGYLLTGESEFLAPLRHAWPRMQANQRALDSLAAHNPRQQQQLDTLRRLVARRYALLQSNLAHYQRRQQPDRALLRQGNAGMDRVRAAVGRLQATERAQLARRRAQALQWGRHTPPLVAGLTLLALLVAGLASWRLHRSRAAEHRARQEIRNRRITLQAILDAATDGLTIYEPVPGPGGQPTDFRLRLLNPAAERAVGCTGRDLGRCMSELFPDSVASGRLGHYQQVMATGQPWETEFFAEAWQRWFRLVASRANRFLLLSATDISDRKRLELAALDYQQRKYEAVFNQTDQAVCLLDARGCFLEVNDTVLRLGGGTRPDYLGRYCGNSDAWTLPGTPEQLAQAIARAARGETVRADLALRWAGNQVSYFDISLTPVRGEAGNILFLLAEGRDITERVRGRRQLEASHAELRALSQTLEQRVLERTAALEESRARFAQLLEALPNMAWTSRPDGTPTYYNQLWTDYTGVPPETLLGQGLSAFLHPDDLAPTRAAWAAALRTGQPISDLRNRWRRALDGTYRWHLVRAVPLRDAAGAVRLWVGSNTDIHDQQLQQQELERVNADLDTFVYTASHDLRTPISNIEALLTALREELALPPAQAATAPLLAMMQDSVDRFKRTIRHLTEVTKLQQAHSQQPAAEIDLAALVADVRHDLRPLLAATAGELTVAIAPGQTLAFAERNLRSIVFNLLSNALKYHQPGQPPRVQLRCYATEGFTVLEVQDNGLGLNPAQQAKAFGLFQRLHDHVEGSGLGLYMVKKIIEQAGGRIEVESQPNRGACFRVYFPG